MPSRRLTRFALIATFFLVVTYIFSRYSSTDTSEWGSTTAPQHGPPSTYDPIDKERHTHPISEAIAKIPLEKAASLLADSGITTTQKDLSTDDAPPPSPPPPEVPVKKQDPTKTSTRRKTPPHPVVKAPAAHPEIPTVPPHDPIPTHGGDDELPAEYIYNDIENVHRKVFSVSTSNKEYFLIVFGDNQGYNPNMIPHRTLNDTWIMVSQQQEHSVENSLWFAQWVCNAHFVEDQLECIKPPTILPIAATHSTKCLDNLAFFAFNVGPHDARIFFGPRHPLILYGSQSEFTCFGQWVQDLRVLLDWGFDYDYPDEFSLPVDVQRPGNYGRIEKNWFLFWNKEEEIFVHHDMYPNRVFAKLNRDGSVGPNLAPEAAAAGDDKCMVKYMPFVAEQLQSIHQSTNSLSITLCNRADPTCIPDDTNTFVFTIFHHKSYYTFHSNYEPFVILFHQNAPYNIYAISQKPFWIHGRGGPGQGAMPDWITDRSKWHQTEMFYITSISWMKQGQKLHGYLDDVMFIAFGIEDSMTAGIDVLAGELFKDLGICSDFA